MKSSKPIIIFFHGLNTFGDDQLHLGPATLGRMDLHLKSALENRGVQFFSINGIGSGSPETQATCALDQLANHPSLAPGSSIHLFGQSMGGLVARVVAHRLKTEPEVNPKSLYVKNIITCGTPHRGTVAANFALEFAEKNRALVRGLATVGYDLERNSETFRHYSPQSLDAFNMKYPAESAAPEHTLICAVPLRSVSRYFLGFYRRLHGLGRLEMIRGLFATSDSFAPSDGFIPVGSQNWAHVYGPYGLDHFAQMGFFSMVQTPSGRAAAKLEFQRFCDDIVKLTSDNTS